MSGTRVTTTSVAVRGAEQQPEEQDAEDHREREPVALVLHQRRRGDVGKRHDRADREVDAAGDDDDRLGTAAKATGRTPMARPG